MIRVVMNAAAVLLALTGCGQAPDPAPTGTRKPDLQEIAKNARRPEITAETIAGDIAGKKLSVPELHGDYAEEQWTIDAGAIRQLNIQEKTVTGNGETLVVFVTTASMQKPNKAKIQIAGKLELQYEWKDKWVLATVRNLTVRYTVAPPG